MRAASSGAIPSQSDHALSRAKAPVACICRKRARHR